MKFDESKHPRASDGRFGNKAGESSKDEYPNETKRLDELTDINNGTTKQISKPVTQNIQNNTKQEQQYNVVKIDLSADIQKQFENATMKERQKLAYRYIMDNLSGKYTATDGRVVALGQKGAKEFLLKPAPMHNVKIKVAPQLAEVIQTGEFINVVNSNKERKDGFDKFAYYSVYLEVGGIMYTGIINVGINSKTQQASFYGIHPLHEIKK